MIQESTGSTFTTRLIRSAIAAPLCGIGLAVLVIGVPMVLGLRNADYHVTMRAWYCFTLGTCAGMVAFAASPRRNLAWSLAFVLAGSILLTPPTKHVLQTFGLEVRMRKGVQRDILESELIGDFVCCAIPAMVLAAFPRKRRRLQPDRQAVPSKAPTFPRDLPRTI
jgi:hypothetical protein